MFCGGTGIFARGPCFWEYMTFGRSRDCLIGRWPMPRITAATDWKPVSRIGRQPSTTEGPRWGVGAAEDGELYFGAAVLAVVYAGGSAYEFLVDFADVSEGRV